MKWTNIKKEMPKHYKTVLALDSDMPHVAQRTVNPEGWIAIETSRPLRDVTHWTKLPELPEEN